MVNQRHGAGLQVRPGQSAAFTRWLDLAEQKDTPRHSNCSSHGDSGNHNWPTAACSWQKARMPLLGAQVSWRSQTAQRHGPGAGSTLIYSGGGLPLPQVRTETSHGAPLCLARQLIHRGLAGSAEIVGTPQHDNYQTVVSRALGVGPHHCSAEGRIVLEQRQNNLPAGGPWPFQRHQLRQWRLVLNSGANVGIAELHGGLPRPEAQPAPKFYFEVSWQRAMADKPAGDG